MTTLVTIESPYAGDVERNMRYLKDCVQDCLIRGESPYASHAFFTQFLDDNVPSERQLGIDAGLAWANVSEYAVFYTDYGMSDGMVNALSYYKSIGKDVLFRRLHGDISG